jgi:hypothetical protein
VFLNQDAFKARILPDPFMATAAPQVIGKTRPPPSSGSYNPNQFWRTCTWGWGCYNGTWTEALLRNASEAWNITNGLPLNSFDNMYPTVIDVDYVCPVYKMKQTGQLLVSIFIGQLISVWTGLRLMVVLGTFSMYTALFGIFAFVAPIFDERYRKKHGLGGLSGECFMSASLIRHLKHDTDDEDEGGARQYGHLPYPYQTPPHSANPYTTIVRARSLSITTLILTLA